MNKKNSSLKRFIPYFKKYKWILVLDLICASLTTVCELVFPMLVRYITDMGINDIQSLTIVRMSVPCCGGIEQAAKNALKASGRFIPWQVVIVDTDGSLRR